MVRRLRSRFAGLPVGAVVGVGVTAVIWLALAGDPGHSRTSALGVAAGVGVAAFATVATVWWGLRTSREEP